MTRATLTLAGATITPFLLYFAWTRLLHSASPAQFHATLGHGTNHLAEIALGALTTAGRVTFDATVPLFHILVIGPPANQAFAALDYFERKRIFLTVSIPFALVATALFWHARNVIDSMHWRLITRTALAQVLLLTAFSVIIGFNYLNDEAARYFSFVAPGLELLVPTSADKLRQTPRRMTAFVLVVSTIVLPGTTSSLARFALVDREAHGMPSSASAFALPSGLEGQAEAVRQAIALANVRGDAVAIYWPQAAQQIAIVTPGAFIFPNDSLHIATEGMTRGVTLIAQREAGSCGPPAIATNSFPASLKWQRVDQSLTGRLGTWRAVP